LPFRGNGRRHLARAWQHRDQRRHAAVDHRQLRHFRLPDRRRDDRLSGFDERRLAADGDGLRDRGNAQLQLHGHVGAGEHLQPLARLRRETGELRTHVVDPRVQRGNRVQAFAIGDRIAHGAGRSVGHRDGHARQHGTGLVHHAAADAGRRLGEHGAAGGETQKDSEPNSIQHRQVLLLSEH
jgi:hypothetical protein